MRCFSHRLSMAALLLLLASCGTSELERSAIEPPAVEDTVAPGTDGEGPQLDTGAAADAGSPAVDTRALPDAVVVAVDSRVQPDAKAIAPDTTAALPDASPADGPPPALGGGHYISFAKYHDLQQILGYLDSDTPGSYHYERAKRIDAAFRSPGVKGIWMPIYWREFEKADNVFDWAPFDATLEVAKRYGLKLIMKLSTRSFKYTLFDANGEPSCNIAPSYFPDEYCIKTESQRDTSLSGFTSKLWDPFVTTRLIRAYRAIAQRYDGDPSFAGVSTCETATGDFDNVAHNYTTAAYVDALAKIINQSKTAFVNTKLFFYLNFIRGGSGTERAALVDRVQGGNVALGGPDVMADDSGHADALNTLYLESEQKYPDMTKFCHAQFNDHKQRKSNQNRVAPQDTLYDASGKALGSLHDPREVGRFWSPLETYHYGVKNFGCNYFFWHYKAKEEDGAPAYDAAGQIQYYTSDVLPVIAAFGDLR